MSWTLLPFWMRHKNLSLSKDCCWTFWKTPVCSTAQHRSNLSLGCYCHSMCHPFWGQSLAQGKASASPAGCDSAPGKYDSKAVLGALYCSRSPKQEILLTVNLQLTLVLRNEDRIMASINMTKVMFLQEMQLLQCFKLGRRHTEIPDVE